ncbi:glycerophosphodiester phosphodiesterase family protein [Acinetobacter sp. WZC-1]|uniref:glycerophosphodiester phosphodiesterase family protein n=1 Tax=Acinetobacter sp. WZC-1 TaxID=3459034 RepID=UPI00403DD546
MLITTLKHQMRTGLVALAACMTLSTASTLSIAQTQSGYVMSNAKPLIVAHRGGTADAPENTLYAIDQALKNKADIIWVTVQLSSDNIPVLYRPTNLNALTDGQGAVSQYSVAQLKRLDAGWNIARTSSSGQTTYPWRGQGIGIPTLKETLQRYPRTTFYLDIKSPDASPTGIANAIKSVLTDTGSLGRVKVYSTERKYTDAIQQTQRIPYFVARDDTRDILSRVALGHDCQASSEPVGWHGLELRRQVEVVESYTLGEGRSKASFVWDKEIMRCFRSEGKNHVVLFGVNSVEDYRLASQLGAEAVMVDSPALFRNIK